MLILTRKIGETIVINDNIKITTVGVRVNQVRIGIDAPRDVTVHREEVYKRIQESLRKEDYRNNDDAGSYKQA